MTSTRLLPVTAETFGAVLTFAQSREEQIREATSEWDGGDRETVYYLTDDLRSGCAIAGDAELRYVFSTVKGRGDLIVQHAIRHGAVKLDCFDGYLTTLYTRNGFEVYHREPNYVAGGPDVVYMRLGV
jgi:hypothetical protein